MAKTKAQEVQINWKYWWMSAAEILDAFRTIPRILVAGYAFLVWKVVDWFMSLPEPTTEHTFLVSTVIGGAAAVFGLYVNSGSSWDRKSARKDLYMEYNYTPTHQMPTRRKSRGHVPSQQHQSFDEIEIDFEAPPSKIGQNETPPNSFLDNTTG
jgi:hypothetical protein